MGRSDVPVYAGSRGPFCRTPAYAPDIHGESGLDGTTCLPCPTVPAREDKVAVEAMCEALSDQPPETAWLVATGACTNIALLFTTYPGLIDHIAGLSIMGGAIGGGFNDAPLGTVQGQGERIGNHTPWAEFNIYIDPESARSIFMNPTLAAKTTLIPLDLTHTFLGTKEVQRGLLYGFDRISSAGQPTIVRKLFHEILTFFAKTYADVFGLTEGPPLHDPLAVAACFVPELFDDRGGERFKIDVVIEGDHGVDEIIRNSSSQCGRTIATKAEIGVRIPKGLNSDILWRMLELSLGKAERSSSHHSSARDRP